MTKQEKIEMLREKISILNDELLDLRWKDGIPQRGEKRDSQEIQSIAEKIDDAYMQLDELRNN